MERQGLAMRASHRIDGAALFGAVLLGLCVAALFTVRPWRRSTIHWTDSLDSALVAAKGKPVFVEISAEWCGPCREMERDTFTDTGVAQAIQPFHPVRLDYDKPATQAKLADWGAIGLPAHLLISPSGKVQAMTLGKLTPEQLIHWLRRHSA